MKAFNVFLAVNFPMLTFDLKSVVFKLYRHLIGQFLRLGRRLEARKCPPFMSGLGDSRQNALGSSERTEQFEGQMFT